MTPLEDQIRDLYRQLTDGEQPRARVSIAEALRRGRLLRRRRRFSAVATPVVAAAAVAGIALAATLPAHDNGGVPVRHLPANPAAPPGQFDPLVVNMSFGWLPPGEAALTGDTGMVNGSLTVYQERNLNLNSYTSRDANNRWRLSDWVPSVCRSSSGHNRVQCPGQVGFFSSAAPDINGHRAFWESGYWPHQALVWTYAPGYSAELTSSAGFRQSDQTLLRIARSVAFGGDAAQNVKFAVQLTGVPSGWRIGSTFVTRVSGNWLAEDDEVTSGKRVLWADAAGTYNGLPEVTTYVGGGNCGQFSGYFDYANQRRVNGYQVETTTGAVPTMIQQATHGRLQSAGLVPQPGPPMAMLCAPHADGLLVFESLESLPHGPRVSLTTLFQHMILLGPKPSAWTTLPIG